LADAREYLGRATGWPAVPAVCSYPAALEVAYSVVPGNWKACHVAAWVGQRPFVWFEDDADAVGRIAVMLLLEVVHCVLSCVRGGGGLCGTRRPSCRMNSGSGALAGCGTGGHYRLDGSGAWGV